MAHQPRRLLGLLGRKVEARAQFERDLGAQRGVVAAAPLGHVVQEQREIKHPPRQHLVDDPGGKRQRIGELAALDPSENADREDGVLIDRVDVIHVVLHLRDDAAEIGDQAAQHAGLVHPPQRGLGIIARGKNLDEQAVGLGVRAQLRADALEVPGDQPQRPGVDVEAARIGDVEQPDHRRRIAREGVLGAHRQPPALDHEAVDLAAERTQARQADERGALVLGLDRRAEDAGEVADVLGHQEVVLHEALDAFRAGALGVARAPGDLGLDVEGEALLGAPGEVMELTADRPQERVGLGEAGVLLGLQHAAADELGHVADAVEVLGDPQQRVEVAQPPLAVLDVGLEHVARIAHTRVPLVAFVELGAHELGPRTLDQLGGEAAAKLAAQRPVATDVARFQKVGADRHVAARAAQAFARRARRVADLEPQVPQHVEHELDHLLDPRR